MDFFCPYCVVRSKEILATNIHPCSFCSQHSYNCRHWDVTDEAMIDKTKEYLTSIGCSDIGTSEYFERDDFINACYKYQLSIDDIPFKETNPSHIAFDYRTHTSNQPVFSLFLKNIVENVMIRKRHGKLDTCDISGTNVEIKGRLSIITPMLLEELKNEELIKKMRLILRREDQTSKERLLPVVSMIPDVMHLLNRTIERVIKILFIHGSRQYMSTNNRNLGAFQKSIEDVVNSSSFRYKSEPADDVNDQESDCSDDDKEEFHVGKKWSFPIPEKTTDLVGDVNMLFAQAKKFIEKIHLLYSLCLPPTVTSSVLLKSAIEKFQHIMKVIQIHRNLEEEEIDDLELKIHNFSNDWIGVAGIDGITNYFHYIIAGHVIHFLRRYKNYYRYMQQGWEQLNSWIKVYILHHTQRGGHGAKKPNYLKPLYRHFQRSFAWRSGIGDVFLIEIQLNSVIHL